MGVDSGTVVWLSPSYGYGNDLMYYAGIFRAVGELIPGQVIPAVSGYPVDRYPDLALLPIVDLSVRKAAERFVNGVSYGAATRRVPSVASLRRIWRLNAAAYIVIEFTPLAVCGMVMAKLRRRPLLLLIESDPRFRGGPTRRSVTFLKRALAGLSDVVMVSNETAARFATTVLRQPLRKLIVKPYLTSVPYLATPPKPSGPRPAHVTKLLFVNSITPRKGLAELLFALAALPSATGRDVQLDVVGDGPSMEVCRALAVHLDIADLVTFHGRVAYESLGPYYEQADVVVCPTLGDYRSLAGIEAIAAGKPLIISRFDGAAAELLALDGAAVQVDPRDTAEFASAIIGMIEPSALSAAGDAARAASEAFSYKSIAANIQLALGRAVAARPGRRTRTAREAL